MPKNIKPRRIAVFTGNRAEYSMLFPVLKALSKDKRLSYHLIVSGAHLKSDFGHSLKIIEQDGFVVAGKVPIESRGDDLLSTASAIGSCIRNIGPVLEKLKPDLMIVAADRFEGFAALIASTQMGIPTAHIEGGDYTEGGALDDSVRHAMTKLAHLHFTTNEQSSKRVIGLGEEPWRVINVGFPPIDTIKEGRYASPEEVYKKFALDPGRPVFVFTQHSVSTEYEQASRQIRGSLMAIEHLAKKQGVQFVITYPNDDAGGKAIIQEIENLQAKNIPGIIVQKTLGRYYYHGLLNIAKGCVGNSSSGIKETIPFRCPCVNIGSRQQGRLKGQNIIEVGYDKNSIQKAIGKCLNDGRFLRAARSCKNPYGAGNAGTTICDIVAGIPLDARLLQKKMTF